MADIVINEISQNYSYVIGDSSYCCVALPITASWGPAYKGFDSAQAQEEESKDSVLENIVWSRFKANSQGLESFVSTYRSAAANYRLSQDYSYQIAVSLLTAGYDVLVCRLCPGAEASSMLRRSYVGTIPADWFDRIDTANGTLKLPIKENAEASSELSSVPFTVSSDHPVTITSTNPNFKSTPITSILEWPITSEMATGTYAIPVYSSVSNVDVTLVYTGNDIKKPESGSQDFIFVDKTSPQALRANIPDFWSDLSAITVKSAKYYDPSEANENSRWKDLQVGNDYGGMSQQLGISILHGSEVVPATHVQGSKLQATFTITYVKFVPNTLQFVYHVKDNATLPSAWASAGISTNSVLTYTGDKTLETLDGTGSLTIKAKYPGTFGNRLQCTLRRMTTVGLNYWNFIVYVVDNSGVRLAVENLNFVFDIENSTDNILFVDEVKSQFVDITATNLSENSKFTAANDRLTIVFNSGTDKDDSSNTVEALESAMKSAAVRFNTELVAKTGKYTFTGTSASSIARNESFVIPTSALPEGAESILSIDTCTYQSSASAQAVPLAVGTDYSVESDDKRTIKLLSTSTIIPAAGVDGSLLNISFSCPEMDSSIEYVEILCKNYNDALHDQNTTDKTTASTWKYLEWLFTNSLDIYDLLNDKLAYNPNRVISPGWDDQNFLRLTGEDTYTRNITTPSPLHLKLMEVAYYSRCATAYIDLPKSIAKKYVSNDSQNAAIQGYAQLLARQEYPDTDGLFTTHSALFGPWGTYRYVGMSRQSTASPSFLALLIQRSMILNQSLQYEWIQPSSRKNKVNIGKMDYTVSKKYLDIWQPDPDTDGGVGVNAIANIPDLGLSIWGDSTLYENPPATYQALRNLSTRLLVNAIKNVVYKVGISITFQYTNQTAFSSFYVGVTPILDSMKNAGAIGDYKVVIGNDFDAVGMVKANSCVGKIYITPNGTIQHITVDLIALPPQTDLSNYS